MVKTTKTTTKKSSVTKKVTKPKSTTKSAARKDAKRGWLAKRLGLLQVSALLLVVIAALTIGIQTMLRAQEWDWISETPTVSAIQDESFGGQSNRYCGHPYQKQETGVVVTGISAPGNGCITTGLDGFKFGVFDPGYTVVGFPGDTSLTIVAQTMCTMTHPYCVYLPEKNILVAREKVNNGFLATKLVIYKNFKQRLTKVPSDSFGTMYNFDDTNPELVLNDSDGGWPDIRFIGASQGGKWVVASGINSGTFRIDTDTLTVKKFTNDTSDRIQMSEYSISPDGRNVAIMGEGVSPKIYQVDDSCGANVQAGGSSTAFANNVPNPCRSYDLAGHPDLTIQNLTYAYAPRFSDDGGNIRFYANSSDNFGQTGRWVTLTAHGYSSSPSPTPSPTTTATPTPDVPVAKEECWNDNWKKFGTMFKNQGSCVSFVSNGKLK